MKKNPFRTTFKFKGKEYKLAIVSEVMELMSPIIEFKGFWIFKKKIIRNPTTQEQVERAIKLLIRKYPEIEYFGIEELTKFTKKWFGEVR